ncbi:hypothetical protein J6590_066751 [Homalodisca vitripennis]|nr:hypothetical protein J6590_066751 [Homalodisca vitripennis]
MRVLETVLVSRIRLDTRRRDQTSEAVATEIVNQYTIAIGTLIKRKLKSFKPYRRIAFRRKKLLDVSQEETFSTDRHGVHSLTDPILIGIDPIEPWNMVSCQLHLNDPVQTDPCEVFVTTETSVELTSKFTSFLDEQNKAL